MRSRATALKLLFRQAHDIGRQVLPFLYRQLHVGHLGVGVAEVIGDAFGGEAGHFGDCGEAGHVVGPMGLVRRDDMAGSAPAPRQLLAVRRVGGVSRPEARRGERQRKSEGAEIGEAFDKEASSLGDGAKKRVTRELAPSRDQRV